jgi:hypothetical protein
MPKRVDENQPQIVKALRRVGASVQHMHEIGKGCFDLLVGFRSQNFVIEVKNPHVPVSKRRLTPDEQEWSDAWQGQKAIALTEDDALRIIGAIK